MEGVGVLAIEAKPSKSARVVLGVLGYKLSMHVTSQTGICWQHQIIPDFVGDLRAWNPSSTWLTPSFGHSIYKRLCFTRFLARGRKGSPGQPHHSILVEHVFEPFYDLLSIILNLIF